MADQGDVRRIALSLPESVEAGDRFAFSTRNKGKLRSFVWAWMERVTPKKPRVPNPDVIAVRVADLDEKAMLLSMDAQRFFTEPHYDGFAAVLVRLPETDLDLLELLIKDAWPAQAPRALVSRTDS